MKPKVKRLIETYCTHYAMLQGCSPDMIAAFDAVANCYRNGGKLLLCGNGGSAADADHIVGELMNKFMLRRPIPEPIAKILQEYDNGEYLAHNLQQSLPAISLVTSDALITAVANDIGADMVFAQQVYGYGKPGDVLWVLSTSGNSINVVNAVKVANACGLITIGFTGKDGGVLKSLCDIMVRVPESLACKVQELHLPAYHMICAMLEEEFFGSSTIE